MTFIKYVHEHLLEKAQDVVRLRTFLCPYCGHPVRDTELAREILADEGASAEIRCQQRNAPCGSRANRPHSPARHPARAGPTGDRPAPRGARDQGRPVEALADSETPALLADPTPAYPPTARRPWLDPGEDRPGLLAQPAHAATLGPSRRRARRARPDPDEPAGQPLPGLRAPSGSGVEAPVSNDGDAEDRSDPRPGRVGTQFYDDPADGAGAVRPGSKCPGCGEATASASRRETTR